MRGPARLRGFYTRPLNLYEGYTGECLAWPHCNDVEMPVNAYLIATIVQFPEQER